MSDEELLGLARTRMRNPSVWVRQNDERVWIAEAINFDCAEGVEVHGQSESFVRTALEGTLRCFPEITEVAT